MLSRVADNLYWFGRYLQRAENTARLVLVHDNLLLDLPRKVTLGWAPLTAIIGAEESFKALYDEATQANVVRFLTVDPRHPASILTSLSSAREILRTSRDTMPQEVWERLNDLHMDLKARGERGLVRPRRQDLLQGVVDGSLNIYGILTSSMSRDVGFQFLRMGTSLEQADMTTRILDVRSTSLIRNESDLGPYQNIQWMSVLRSLTAYQMYRRHVRHRVTGGAVLRFLLQDRQFPRSVAFSLALIGSTLPHLPNHRSVERALERITALVHDANIEKLLETGLHEFIDEVQIGLGALHGAISAAYFKL